MKERIAVCGLGKVGRPILDMLRVRGFKAVGYDYIPRLTEVKLSTAVDESDAAIFIVQTPSLPDGSFSNEYLVDALKKFKSTCDWMKKKDYLYIVSSTTVPGSCEGFREIVGDNIAYKPEFIRLEHVRTDLVNPAWGLIGAANQEAQKRTFHIFSEIPEDPITFYAMSLTEAELAKITLNCALTMKISLANQLHLVAQKMGCDSAEIMHAVGADPRIGRAHLKPGWPYGGPCLPRDNRMFQYVARKVGIEAHLSEAADKINKAMQ